MLLWLDYLPFFSMSSNDHFVIKIINVSRQASSVSLVKSFMTRVRTNDISVHCVFYNAHVALHIAEILQHEHWCCRCFATQCCLFIKNIAMQNFTLLVFVSPMFLNAGNNLNATLCISMCLMSSFAHCVK